MLLLWRFLGIRRLIAMFIFRRIWRMMQARRTAAQPR
jgi:hypothetical protein